MLERIPLDDREMAWELYQKGRNFREIASAVRVSNYSAWVFTAGRERGFNDSREYNEELAKRHGFKNRSGYQEHLINERKKRRPNKDLSHLIKFKLKKLGKNQSWLAEQLSVTRASVSLYALGKSIPHDELLTSLFHLLKIDKIPKSLDYSVAERSKRRCLTPH